MRILLLSTYDRSGGAETIARDLLHAYQAAGHDARMVVRYRRSNTPNVYEADAFSGTSPLGPLFAGLDQVLSQKRFRGVYRMRDTLRHAALPQRWLDRRRGIEDFNYPYTGRLLDQADWRPDAIHAHNIHGDFVDLRALPELSRRIPLIWTLHDAWALTGHCAYPIDCERWKQGCGSCPDLRRPPAIQVDATAANWQRKAAIYRNNRLAVATPSRWLMGMVERSMLQPWQSRVLPYGVDTATYRPGDRAAARAALGLPQNGLVALFVAMDINSTNPYKDVTTVRTAIQQTLAARPSDDITFVGLGRTGNQPGDPRMRFPGYISDQQQLAQYYQAADVLLHAAHADNYPCVIQESLACGTPVIGSAIGGIPEQIHDGVTGWLVPRSDAGAMSRTLLGLLDHPDQLESLRHSARAAVGQLPSIAQMAENYLEWFAEIRTLLEERVAV